MQNLFGEARPLVKVLGLPADRPGTNRWALVDDDFEFDTTAPGGRFLGDSPRKTPVAVGASRFSKPCISATDTRSSVAAPVS